MKRPRDGEVDDLGDHLVRTYLQAKNGDDHQRLKRKIISAATAAVRDERLRVARRVIIAIAVAATIGILSYALKIL